MPSLPTDPASRQEGHPASGDPLARLSPRKARLSQALAIVVSTLALAGAIIAIPVVRAVAPAVVQAVIPIMVRAVVRLPIRPAVPPAKTTACTHHRMQAGPSHRHVCG